MAPAQLSRLEELLLAIDKPISILIHLWNDRFHYTVPTDRLNFVLSIASCLPHDQKVRRRGVPRSLDKTASAVPAATLRVAADFDAKSSGKELRASNHQAGTGHSAHPSSGVCGHFTSCTDLRRLAQFQQPLDRTTIQRCLPSAQYKYDGRLYRYLPAKQNGKRRSNRSRPS